MDFRTQVDAKADFTIGYSDKIMMMGSCFAENIGQKMRQAKLDVLVNPFGILFNPESIAIALEQAMSGKKVEAGDVFFHNGLWSGFGFHGSFSSPDKDIALRKMNDGIAAAHSRLANLSLLIITFGSAFVYQNAADGRVVANCHKLPANNFVREMLSVDFISNRYSELVERLTSLNPDLQIVLTVSPVRHLRDGAHQNQLSKSTLLLAADNVVSNFANAHYFPSYELLLDDLRDYRFYDTDMVHPSAVAVDYIWQNIRNNCIDKADNALMDEISKIITAANHRPLNPDTEEHKQFAKRQREITTQFAMSHPYIDLSEEIMKLETALKPI
ncbi:MAG: GSCFA domain-containing protein [Salinivirgaceae bacterium]|nr:GSCFA domain-containing protein [Salinivirgaceae bacterium]